MVDQGGADVGEFGSNRARLIGGFTGAVAPTWQLSISSTTLRHSRLQPRRSVLCGALRDHAVFVRHDRPRTGVIEVKRHAYALSDMQHTSVRKNVTRTDNNIAQNETLDEENNQSKKRRIRPYI